MGLRGAVVHVLHELGFSQITLYNRSRRRAEQLITDFPHLTTSLHLNENETTWLPSAKLLATCDLLINTTSLGMVGQPLLALDLTALPAHAVVADIVFKPLQTDLLKQAVARSLTTVDGLGMLLHQAAPAFEKFFGIKPEVTDELRQHVLKEIT